AKLCPERGRGRGAADGGPLPRRAAALVDAIGLVVWAWDPLGGELRPAASHGYSDQVLSQLPKIRRESDNATAAAFRLAQTCTVRGSDQSNGALVVPLLTPVGCVGVLALELRPGRERVE